MPSTEDSDTWPAYGCMMLGETGTSLHLLTVNSETMSVRLLRAGPLYDAGIIVLTLLNRYLARDDDSAGAPYTCVHILT